MGFWLQKINEGREGRKRRKRRKRRKEGKVGGKANAAQMAIKRSEIAWRHYFIVVTAMGRGRGGRRRPGGVQW